MEYHLGYYVHPLRQYVRHVPPAENAIFRLGNTEKNCRPETITSNHHLAKTGVPRALSCLDKVVKWYRQERQCLRSPGAAPWVLEVLRLRTYSTFLRACETVSMVTGRATRKSLCAQRSRQRKLLTDRMSADLQGLSCALLLLVPFPDADFHQAG